MEDIRFSIDTDDVTPRAAIDLFVAAGLGSRESYREETMWRALNATTLLISAFTESGRVVGLLRVLSDGVFSTHVAGISVHPEWQRQNIGTQMMDIMLRHYGHTPCYVEPTADSMKFFTQFGYQEQHMLHTMSRRPDPVRNRRTG